MIKTCGAPNRIIFEQGTAFTSRQFSDFAVEIGTKHHVCFRVYHEEMVRMKISVQPYANKFVLWEPLTRKINGMNI
jgi:hypothetical protein